jgi:hypothetical protein
MGDTKFEVIPIGDAEAFDKLHQISKEVRGSKPKFTLEVMSGVRLEDKGPEDPELVQAFRIPREDPSSGVWRSQVLKFNLPNATAQLTFHRDEKGVTIVTISLPNDAQPDHATALLRSTLNHFQRTNTIAAIEKTLGAEFAQFYRKRDESLLRLEALSQKLIEQNEAYRRNVDEKLAADQQALRKELETDRERLEAAYKLKDGAVLDRENNLAKEKLALDLRSAQQVRRDNVKGLKGTIADRTKSFNLTSETQRKRWPIHASFVILLLVSAAVAVIGLFYPPAATAGSTEVWLHLLRVPAGVIGFAFASVFYIRWNDQWFRQHADEEFRMRQLELDIDRASWITELALELRDEKGELTAALLDRLSAGLFTSRSSEAVKHPTQDLLAALLGESSLLRIKSPRIGIEAEVGRRGIRRAEERVRDTE